MANIKTVNIDELIPYEYNAKVHTSKQINQIAESIKQYGMNSLIQVWPDPEGRLIVVVGNGRLAALKKLRVKTTEVEVLDHLTDDERKAYGLIDNQLTLNTPFDMDKLNMELENLGPDIDLSEFDLHLTLADEIEKPEDSQEYLDYLKKFNTVKTPDDTFTPPKIYDAVKKWAMQEYGIPDTAKIIRPFRPGGDYQKEEYPNNCVVIDNPPFSILAEIQRWYIEHHINFFLFCEGTCILSTTIEGVCHIIVDAKITYDNGAVINTGFLTNMSDYAIQTRPDLKELIKEASDITRKENSKIEWPQEVLTIGKLVRLADNGQDIRLTRDQLAFTRKAGEQPIYGAGYLMSHDATLLVQKGLENAEQKKPTTIVKLTDREREMIDRIGTTEARQS